jgi:hypothetical protein
MELKGFLLACETSVDYDFFMHSVKSTHFPLIFVKLLVGTIFTLFLLRAYSNSTLLFEQIWLSSLISFFLTISMYFRNISRSTFREILLISMIVGSLVTHTLVNVDRSRSFYVLSWIDKQDISYKNSALQINSYVSEELRNSSGVTLRIREAEKRNLIQVDNRGDFQLTFLGSTLLKISESLSYIFQLSLWKKETT